MSEMVERVAKALFRSRCFPEHEEFWPDRIDEIVSGPPFDADGFRGMSRAAIEAMREPTGEMVENGAADFPIAKDYGPEKYHPAAKQIYQAMIDEALK